MIRGPNEPGTPPGPSEFLPQAAGIDEVGARLISPINRAAFDYWLHCRERSGLDLPRREDIDPLEMRSFLTHVVMLDVQPEPLDFCYRLIGGTVRYHLRSNHTGLWMSAIPHQKPPSRMFDVCATVVRRRMPVIGDIPYIGPHTEIRTPEDLLMPLSNADGEVAMLFICIDYFRKDGRLAEEPSRAIG